MSSLKTVIINFLLENKETLFGYLFFSMAVPISNIYLPHLYGSIISLINKEQTISANVKIRFICIFILWIFLQFFGTALSILDKNFIPKLKNCIREYIAEKIITVYKENYAENELSQVIANIVKLPDLVEQMFDHFRYNILPMGLMLIFSIGYFTWASPVLGAISTASITLYLFIAWKMSYKCVPIWTEMNDNYINLHGNINDCLGNLLNVYTSNQDDAEIEKIKNNDILFGEIHSRAIECTGNLRTILNISYIVLFCGINIVSFWLFSKQKIGLDKVVSILVITLELISKMSTFVTSMDEIGYEFTTIMHAQEELDKLTRTSDTEKGKLIVPLEGSITFNDVCVSFTKNGKTIPVLNNLSFTFNHGTRTALMGQIGSGKSTLINALCRLIPFKGSIFVGNTDINTVNINCLREQILYIPQNPKLFNKTIFENISYGNPSVTKELVQEAFDKYSLDFDLDKSVGKFGTALSGGQRQTIYLLRCLFRNSPIVLLDEPTSALDASSKEHLLKILIDLFTGRTVILITHDNDVLKYMDNIVTLGNGTVKGVENLR
jgi:ATP-binding cassette, subfamily B, bacterial